VSQKCLRIALKVVLSLVALAAIAPSQALAAGKTITAVMHSDLRIIDPHLHHRLHHPRPWLHGL